MGNFVILVKSTFVFQIILYFSSIIEDETIYNEKLLKLAFSVSELTFLQAKQQAIEDRLQIAKQRNESHAVIEVYSFIKYLKLFYSILFKASFG
jgi:hypothetical protein